MNFYQRYKKRRSIKKTKKYLRSVQKAVTRNVRQQRFQKGRETTPLWKRGFLYQTDMPLRRQPHRDKNVIEVLKLMRDINPDASMAVWNFLRLANQGHEVEVIGSDDEVDEEMQTYINSELAPRMGKLYAGGTDQLINVLNLTGYTEGAEALEVELNESLDEVVDFHPISPSRLDFKPNKETGELELVEKQTDGTFKVLNENQVFYVPIDPDVDDPYGRSPMLPAIEAIIFQVEVLRDLKAVAHHQGHARFDISVSAEAILKNLPMHILEQGDEAVDEFVNSYMDNVFVQFEDLEADDDFLHDDSATVQTVGGTNGKSMDSKALVDIINQQVVTSLKQLPILLGRNESTTETHGSIQWEIHVAGVKSIQSVTKRLLEKAYGVALQIKGSQSTVKVTFNDVRTKDRKAEADAEKLEIENEIAKVNQGWIDNDEASNKLVGHDAVTEPKQTQAQTGMSTFQSFLESKQKLTEDDEDEEGRKFRKFPSKALFSKRGARKELDDFVLGMGDEFSEELALAVPIARDDFLDLLQSQLVKYQERLKSAGNPPERTFNGNLTRDDDDLMKEFKEWLTNNVLTSEAEDVKEWEKLLSEWLTETIVHIGRINLLTIAPEIQFNAFSEILMEWIGWQSENSAIEIVGTSYKDVMGTLFDVIYDGPYSIDKASEALNESFGFSEARAQVIARTEILTAGTTGQFQSDYQAYEKGIVIGKVWRSALQENTRHAHREADGQVQEFTQPFIVDSEELMYPRDRDSGASGKNTIQCRCFYTRLLAGEEELLEKEYIE